MAPPVPRLRVETLVALILLYAIALGNGPWWVAVGAGRSAADPAAWLFFACTFVALVALHFVVIVAFASRWTVRPLLTVLVIATAFAAYYMRTYSVMLDPGMLRNVVRTDLRETRELLSWSMAGWVLAWSAPPVAFTWWVRLEMGPLLRAAGFRVACVAGALACAVIALLPVSRDMTSLMRNQHEARYLITPGNFLYSLAHNAARDAGAAALPHLVLGADARRAPRLQPAGGGAPRPRVVVMVLGETARAANFSLFGYARPTNPRLAALDLVAFSDVTSCGTSTEVSVPCLFSRRGRADYDEQLIRRSDGVLQVLRRAGYAVRWLDNQSGCKGACDGPGIVYRKLDAAYAPDLCRDGECFDGILVRALGEELDAVSQDTVFVLHMIGNHGPAYHRRYPDSFRRFVPDCRTDELRRCERGQIVNAFDNALLYTDHVLAETIGALVARRERLEAMMLYVSDHGESLGEGDLYLHGMPRAIAPRVQTQVPMLVWSSPEFVATTGLSRACLRSRVAEPLSHDNVFDTLLGAADVRTAIYRPELDLFARCRTVPGAGAVTARLR